MDYTEININVLSIQDKNIARALRRAANFIEEGDYSPMHTRDVSFFFGPKADLLVDKHKTKN